MTTVQIDIPDRQAAALKAYAQARGLTVEQWFLQMAEQSAPSLSLQLSASPEDDRPIWEIFVESMKDVPREALAALPKDGASQIDHYLYGHPKA
jgi:hypothetical protein